MATILIVDDRPGNREFLVTLLGYMQHRLLEASDGEEALVIALAERPDLVITDVLMPAVDGYELVRQMRLSPSIAHIPVIFYTAAYEQDEANVLAKAIGIVHFLRKPTDPVLILETVNTVLGDAGAAPHVPTEAFDRAHLRLITDTLVHKVDQLEAEIVERKKAEEAVYKLNAELEERVQQRTAHLEVEIRERVRLMDTLQKNTALIEQLNVRLRRAMRETHHRVKNSLQLVAAIVDMEAMEAETPALSADFQRINQHIRTLAAIHDLLAQKELTGDVIKLSAKGALDKLLPMLQNFVGNVSIHGYVQDVLLPMGQVTSLTILVNELVNNAVKHGSGNILVSLSVIEDQASLEVSDQGTGFSADFDPTKSANIGLGLIDSIGRRDLSGEIEYKNCPDGGAKVTVRFPVNKD